jgi:hypothetical protein
VGPCTIYFILSTILPFRASSGSKARSIVSLDGCTYRWDTVMLLCAAIRMMVKTLSGQGEVELAGGKKIHMSPGNIELAEATTGKGDITRTLGNEDRVTLTLPLSDQSGRFHGLSRKLSASTLPPISSNRALSRKTCSSPQRTIATVSCFIRSVARSNM